LIREEAGADKIVQKLKLVQDAPAGIFMMDKDLPGGHSIRQQKNDLTEQNYDSKFYGF
jgi:ferritin